MEKKITLDYSNIIVSGQQQHAESIGLIEYKRLQDSE